MLKIAICSKGRGQGKVKTLKTLAGVFKKDQVFLFVEPHEADEYRAVYGRFCKVVSIKEKDRGLRYARNFVFNYFDRDIVAMLDDDITGFFERESQKKMHRIKGEKIEELFYNLAMDAITVPEVTISYRPSNYLYAGSKKEYTRAWCMKVWNLGILKDLEVKINTENYLYEDYDFSLSIIKAGGYNRSHFDFAFDCVGMGKNPGGVSAYRKERNEASVKYMKEKWGDIIKVKFNETHNQNEVSVSWKKAQKLYAKV